MTELDSNIANLAKVLSLPEADDSEQAEQINAVRGWLATHERWLLILDNADDPQALAAVQTFLPTGLRGHVIVTSCRTDWANDFSRIPVDVFPEAEAAKFLLARAGKGGLDPGPEKDALAIARELGGLPLALEQAGAYIAKYHIDFARYLAELKNSRKKLLDFKAPGSTGHQETVATTWLVNEPHLSPAARAVLQIAAFLAPDDIPRALFEQGGKILAEAAELARSAAFTPLQGGEREGHPELERRERRAPEADIPEALAELAALSLVELEPDGFSCHRLLQAVLLDRLDPESRKLWGKLAVRLVNECAPERPDDVRAWPIWDPLRPHADALLRAIGEDADTDATPLMNQLGLLLKANALYAEAESLYRRALAIDERSYGPEHPNVAIRLNNLALLLEATNRLAEAELLVRRELVITERSYGTEHGQVTRVLRFLARLLQSANRTAEAEPVLRRRLEIAEKRSGKNHPNTAYHINNLARLLQDINRQEEAELLYRRALAIHEQSCGPEDIDVAIDLHSLAQLLKDINRMDEAEPMMKRAAGIVFRIRGADHPSTKKVVDNYQLLLSAMELPQSEIRARISALANL